jgi:hypothetical protein
MNIRATDEYKSMTQYDACAYAEGFADKAPTDYTLAAAWQYIYDNQLWRSLQGWYGRVLFNELIPAGLIDTSPLTK